MDAFMGEHKADKPSSINSMATGFSSALDKVEAVFGPNCFQRWVPDKDRWRQQVLASVFDAQMLGLEPFEVGKLAAKRNEIVGTFKELFTSDDFLKSVDAATNTPTYLRYRVNAVRDMAAELLK
jgi:hypothetical protein